MEYDKLETDIMCSQKVAFNERIQTREIPSRKDAYPTWKHNNLLFDDFIIDDTSIKDDYNDDNSNKKISIGEADVKSIFDQNDKAYKDVASNDFMTVYPSLADCKVPIDDIIHHLTASPWFVLFIKIFSFLFSDNYLIYAL